MPPAAAFLRPSLLASRRNGEGPAGGGVDGIAIPGMGRRVAAVGTEPADDEVGALRGSAPARSAALGWPVTHSLGLPESPTESDSLRVAWDTLAKAVLGRVSASLAGPAAGGATVALGVTSTLAAGGPSEAGADWGFVGSGQTFDTAGGVSVAGAGLAAVASDRISGGATGGLGSGAGRALAAAGATLAGPAGRASRADGTFASTTGALTSGAGSAFASAAGRDLTFGPGGIWALGGGFLTSGADGFLASPAGGAVATAFAAAAVGTPGLGAAGPFVTRPAAGVWDGAGRGRDRWPRQVHAAWAAARSRSARSARPRPPESARPRSRVGAEVPGPAWLGPAGLAGAGSCPFAAGAFAAGATGVLAASGLLPVGTGVSAASGPGLSITGAAGASVTRCQSWTVSDGASGEVDLSCAVTCSL